MNYQRKEMIRQEREDERRRKMGEEVEEEMIPTISRKRKSDAISTTSSNITTANNNKKKIRNHYTIQPILFQIQAYLNAERIRTVIQIVEKIGSLSYLHDEDKKRSWCLLLNHLYENDVRTKE